MRRDPNAGGERGFGPRAGLLPLHVAWQMEDIMKSNVCGIDRIGRVVVGIVLVGVSLLAPDLDMVWRGVLLVIAAVALVTAAIRFCPANALLGLNCCERKEE